MKDAFELRDWLEGKSDGTSLSPQIREAVYILQPRYAPAPKLDIEALLDQIEKENLGAESTFDTEYVIKSATISDALPTKSIADVFSSLEEGPLASPQKIPVSKEADIIPFPKRWVASIGGLIAVACALLFVMPLQQPLQQEAPANQLQKPILRSTVQEDIKTKEVEDVDEAEEVQVRVAEKAKKSRRQSKPAPKPAKEEQFIPEPTQGNMDMHGGILREEAWKDLSKEINVQYRDSSQEELEAMIQGTDLEKVFQAAYVLCVRFPQERGQVENLLRLKVSSEGYKKKIYACLGDLYFQQGNTIEANRLYRKSIRLPK